MSFTAETALRLYFSQLFGIYRIFFGNLAGWIGFIGLLKKTCQDRGGCFANGSCFYPLRLVCLVSN
jgi:hypothetical protein